MAYDYKMVQVPPTIKIAAKNAKEGIAATFLEKVVNEFARQGWEFYRVDTIGVQTEPGCLGSLFGQKVETIFYYVVTFRREK